MNEISRRSELRQFLAVFALLFLFYAAWVCASWPGMLGQDSLAIILEIETDRSVQANKPALWFLFNLLLYGTTARAEIPVIVQTLVCVIVCARILSWLLTRRMYKSFAYCLFFVALAPSVALYASSMYSDGVYAIALCGMLFEVWRCMRRRAIDWPSAIMLFITIPFAVFARPNGVINLLAIVILACALSWNQRKYLLLIAVPWCLAGFGSQALIKYNHPIGSVFPLALYETVGFLEHRPMGLWEFNEPRVTPKTIQALTSNGAKIETLQEYYDHYYWDPLIFNPKGPALMALSKKNRKTIIKEFFKYNVWHNFPAFAASRVNVFLFSALARAAMPGPRGADYILEQTQSVSTRQAFDLPTNEPLLKWFDFSVGVRAIYWAPWLGLWLISVGALRCARTRDKAACTVSGIFVLQLAAVFVFSIAGEYRYILAFFTAPLALLPVLYSPSLQDNDV